MFLKTFSSRLTEEQFDKLQTAISLTALELWSSKKQYFINNSKPILLGIKLKDKSDMIRWSQAWMAFVLSYKPIRIEGRVEKV